MKNKISWLKISLLFFGCILSVRLIAQIPLSGKIQEEKGFQWPEGKKMAMSLTFDDARLSQPAKGIPLLDKYDIKATFYVSPGNMISNSEEWKKAALKGHDIGNHTVVHPCSGNFLWSRNKALEDYTLEKMKTELDSANRFIEKITGHRPVSFGYPCGQTFVGRGPSTRSYVPLISEMFESGRGYRNEVQNDPAYCDLSQLAGIELDGKSWPEILKMIEVARAQGLWLILAGHETDTEGYQTSQLTTIEAICKYATDPANGIWIDNVHAIAAWIKSDR